VRQQQSGSDSVAKTPKGKITAKTESKELAKENLDRIELVITNEGSKNIWLAFGGKEAVAKEGPFMKAETGSFNIGSFTGPVHVITAEGESNVTYGEI